MGAESIIEYVPKTEHITSAQDAYDALHERDLYEHGHGGYTGSWAEVPGIVPATVSRGQHLLLEEAMRVANESWYGNDGPQKWESGFWLPVYSRLPKSERTVQLTLNEEDCTAAQVTACFVGGAQRLYVGNARHLAKAANLRPGEQVVSYKVDAVPVRRKATVRTTSGPVETRYFVLWADGSLGAALRWERGYATQAEARAALSAAFAGTAHKQAPTRGEVIAVRRRANGEALVTAEMSPVPPRAKANLTVAIPGEELAGWVLYAVASSWHLRGSSGCRPGSGITRRYLFRRRLSRTTISSMEQPGRCRSGITEGQTVIVVIPGAGHRARAPLTAVVPVA